MDDKRKEQKALHEKIVLEIKNLKSGQFKDSLSQEQKIQSLLDCASVNLDRYQRKIHVFRGNDDVRKKQQELLQKDARVQREHVPRFWKQLRNAILALQKKELHQGANEETIVIEDKSSKGTYNYGDEEKTIEEQNEEFNKKLFAPIYAVQDENMQTVTRLVMKATNANYQAAEINEHLVFHRERLEKISRELDTLEGTVKRASREVSSFLRGVATDKCLLVLCLFIVVLILICVVGAIVCKAGVCKIFCEKVLKKGDECPSFLMR